MRRKNGPTRWRRSHEAEDEDAALPLHRVREDADEGH
jgi:hypothetical protein